ncbi:unnamed protein product [Pieris brassicae]|uniref:Uncharacterized protein n=1 Tax=Pieris brassicae TaxID=7116 RepID=A0A9P0XI51_PIEBR|nr:unnamed protein product [Pieris brassicae]
MQKVTLAYNEEDIYEVEDCRNLDFLICKGSLIKMNTCESEILNKKESDKYQAVPIRCPVQEVFQISPKAIYMFFNKTTEVALFSRPIPRADINRAARALGVSSTGIALFAATESLKTLKVIHLIQISLG